MSKPTREEVLSRLHYDPESGAFTWRRTGKPAGFRDRGYIKIGFVIDGRSRARKAHRLAWLYVYGEWPKHEIDHINGVRHDNRIANLREATRSQNRFNVPKGKTNTSGYKGVFQEGEGGKWIAKLVHKKKQCWLGRYATPELAALAYDKAAETVFGQFASLNFPEEAA